MKINYANILFGNPSSYSFNKILSFFSYYIKWWYVYVLRSLKNGAIYIGSTNNIEKRLKQHNNGENQSTKSFLPWRIETAISLRTEKQARILEKYFKTGSGKAILKKRILADETLA